MKWTRMLIGAAVAATILYYPVHSLAAESASEKNKETLIRAYEELLQHYSKPDQEKLLEAAIQGMIQSVDDPYTNYMAPDEYKAFIDSINQNYAGIGIVAVADEERLGLVVEEVFPGTPAEKSGLKAGDMIVKVDGKLPTPGKVQEMNLLIRGKEGTPVTLYIIRDGKEMTVQAIRAQIQLPLVQRTDMGGGVHAIGIRSFGDKTTEEFKKAYKEAAAAGAKGIILDLRGNGGGIVQSALDIADFFLKKGTILIFHDEEGNEMEITADPEGEDIPLAVLIDGNSASASEMLAGALQKNKRAILVGETSFGKGTMQSPVNMPNGAFVKVSIERWELPDGSIIDKKGIVPDIRISHPALAANAAVQALLPKRTQVLTMTAGKDTADLNGAVIGKAPKPVVKNGKVYIPLRFTVEALGSEVRWAGGETSFVLGGKEFKVGKGQDTFVSGGVTFISANAFSTLIGKPFTIGKDKVTIQY
ncbi:S41 family peptidase [Paenibacillus thermotolerans]|uniref:S41 family peptidase n=1 Tax=Paenibacillus thermotolerans TaxID=3027807 RepID=UPI0023684CAA|nr:MULTISPECIES: S41 family peptidase [unclassified Paenibacillus]